MSELAHFTKIDTLIEHILPHMQLRASSLANLNDPLENKWDVERFLTYQSFDGTGAPQEYLNHYLTEQKKLAQHFKIACFASSDHHLSRLDNFPIPQENMRMWAQYGNKHEGVCIIFNKEKVVHSAKQQDDKWIHNEDVLYIKDDNRHVSYTSHNLSEYLQGSQNIEDFFHSNVREMAKSFPNQLFTKRIDWRDEQEYRIVFYSPSSESHFFEISGAIEKIYLGLNCDVENIEKEIRRHIPDCQIFKLHLKNLAISEIAL